MVFIINQRLMLILLFISNHFYTLLTKGSYDLVANLIQAYHFSHNIILPIYFRLVPFILIP